MKLGQEIENSFTVDRRGIYIVTDSRMYRFWARRGGKPRVQWKAKYSDSGIVKPGQVDAGSGTTPTIMKGGYVAITDNADPMNVVVYRTAVHLKRGRRRLVCQVPVFDQGGSATENSLLTNNRSLYVENNYGYQDPFGPNSGAVTAPGFARVDIVRHGTGCRKVWEAMTERGSTRGAEAVHEDRPDLHVHARPERDPGLAALLLDRDQRHDRRDGLQGLRRQWPGVQQQLRGPGARPDGTAYLATTGGMLALRDGPGAQRVSGRS